jgi:hypothetical protein
MTEICSGNICAGTEYISPRGNKCQHFPRLCTACCMHKNKNLGSRERRCTFEHTKLTKRKAAHAAATSARLSVSSVAPPSGPRQDQSGAPVPSDIAPAAVEPDNKRARSQPPPPAAEADSTSTDFKTFMTNFKSLISDLSKEFQELRKNRTDQSPLSEEGTAQQPITLPPTPTQTPPPVSTGAAASSSSAPPVLTPHAFRGQTLVNGPLAQRTAERLIAASGDETVNTLNTSTTGIDTTSIPPFLLTHQSQHATTSESHLFDPIFVNPPSEASAHQADTLQHMIKEVTRERRAPWRTQADLRRLLADQERKYSKQPGATAEKLQAMHAYSIYIEKVAEHHGLDVATNYHFALMTKITEGTHSLVTNGPQCHALWTEHIEYKPRLSSHSGSYSRDRADRTQASSGTNKKKRKGSSPSLPSQRSRSSSESTTSDSLADASCSIHKGSKHTNGECRSSSKRQ